MSLSQLPTGGVLLFLEPEAIAALDPYGQSYTYGAKDMIIQEGAEQTTLFILISGAIEVYREGLDHEISLARLLPGDCFGELAIFEPDQASANVRASEDTTVWAMTAENLQVFLGDHPFLGCALLLGINMLLSQRLAQAGRTIKQGSIMPGFLSVRKRLRTQGTPSTAS